MRANIKSTGSRSRTRRVLAIAIIGAFSLSMLACGDVDEESEKVDKFECGSAALFENKHKTCTTMDATGDGACYCFMGYSWNGTACVGINGCECKGTDCDKLSQTLKECEAVHNTCGKTYECGSADLFSNKHQACTTMEAAGDGACYCFLGFSWNGHACVGVNGCKCKGKDCDKLSQTLKECEDTHGTCSKTYECGSADLYSAKHKVCTTMDAAGDGACYCFLGFGWNGAACVGVNGCKCKGKDCDKLSQTLKECVAAHNTCGKTYKCGSADLYLAKHNTCSTMDAKGHGACYCFLGYSWNGSACVGVNGCECKGADCDKLTPDLKDCEAAHKSCLP